MYKNTILETKPQIDLWALWSLLTSMTQKLQKQSSEVSSQYIKLVESGIALAWTQKHHTFPQEDMNAS